MLPRKYRLSAKEFQRTYQSGSKFRGEHGMLVVDKKSSNPLPRFGFVVSKKIGNAVLRHRFTRLLRTIFLEAVLEFDLEKYPYRYEYVSFKFLDDREILKKEIFELIGRSIK